MKLVYKRAIVVHGEARAVGDTIEVSESIGIELVNMGKCAPVEDAPSITDRAIGLTTKSAAALTKRGKKKK